jgi:GT2 family glycosyltransferase
MKELRFAAFVMTYERPEILLKTIYKLREQTFPPEFIVVVDNSISRKIEILLNKNHFSNLEYIRVGYNSGPAGASKIGLKKLTELGYDWIYWGDDDNPPRDNTVFEHLFEGIKELQNKGVKIGIFGGKGGQFNKFSGRIQSLSNKELKQSKYLAVDSVPGGHTMLVNSEVIKAGALPDENLFFGFEEFDFCLQVINRGFKNYVDTQSWLKVRRNANLVQDNYRWTSKSFGNAEILKREFYSTRNLLSIFLKNRFLFPLLILMLKSLAKMFLGYRYGTDYGNKMFRIQFLALRAFFLKDFRIPGKPK